MKAEQLETVYFEQNTFFNDLFKCIQNAVVSIDLETYIFKDDKLGLQVLKELTNATHRGVSVNLMIDGVGSFFSINNIKELVAKTPINLAIFHPFNLIFRPLSHINKRLHRKLCIIDSEIVFLGSFNIVQISNRDTGVKLIADRPGDFTNIRFNKSKKLRSRWNRDLALKIYAAKKRIFITNAYFAPPPLILKALKMAAKNKTDIRIIVPARSDQFLLEALTEVYFRDLLKVGIRIFEYQNRFLHAKTILADDWAMVGSSNLNYRSFFHDLEVDASLTSEGSLKSLESQFIIDQESSVEITLTALKSRSFVFRTIGRILYLFRYWL